MIMIRWRYALHTTSVNYIVSASLQYVCRLFIQNKTRLIIGALLPSGGQSMSTVDIDKDHISSM